MDLNWDDLLGDFQGRSFSPRQNKNNNNQGMNWLNSLFTGASGVLGNIIQGVFNTRQVEATNKANRELVDAQNAAAKEEAELAYQRSRPENQVANMMNAGMSRAGAINALNGGGSYQPAPVNTAQDQAPQIDTTSAINAIQSAVQLQEQKRQFNMQHAEQKRQFNAQLELQKEESKLKNKLIGEQIHDVISTYTGKEIDNALKDLEYKVQNANRGRRISAEESQYMASEAENCLKALKSLKQTAAWSKLSDEQIAEYYELQAKLEVLANLGNTRATDLLVKVMSVF